MPEEQAVTETTEAEITDSEAFSEIVRMAAELAAAKAMEWAGLASPAEDDRLALSRSLIEQEDEIRKADPEFILQEMMDQSAAFRALVLAGERVSRALEYVQPERAQKRLEEEVLSRIKKRNLRPQGMDAQNRPAEASLPERLDEAEMRRIDAQLKRGQKVYLR